MCVMRCEQYTALDMLNCILAPIFVVSYIRAFQPGLPVTTAWAAAMVAKGYRLGLMLLPSCQQNRTYELYR
jgi:hypothetical protein